MFREILKLIPRIEPADASRMENSLNQRFARISQRFGKGLVSALKGGGIVGAALGILEKLLNPFDQIKETIETSLARADDLKTYADQFGTTSGRLFKLETLAQAKGLEPEQLRQLIGKFQGAVAEAIADPSKVTAVRQFAKPGQDTAEAFFQFIQSAGKLKPEQRTLAQQEIFGEKLGLKAAEFFNTKPEEFTNLAARLGVLNADQFTQKINRGSDQSDQNDIFKAIRSRQGLEESLGKITDGMVEGINVSAAQQESDARSKLGAFSRAKAASDTMDALTNLTQQLLFTSGDTNKILRDINSTMNRIPGLKALRGVLPFGKGD
jgi:hypothetical protein